MFYFLADKLRKARKNGHNLNTKGIECYSKNVFREVHQLLKSLSTYCESFLALISHSISLVKRTICIVQLKTKFVKAFIRILHS